MNTVTLKPRVLVSNRHEISDGIFSEASVGPKTLAPSHMHEKRISGILMFALALLPRSTGVWFLSPGRSITNGSLFYWRNGEGVRSCLPFLWPTSSSGANSRLEDSHRELFVQGVARPSLSVPAPPPLLWSSPPNSQQLPLLRQQVRTLS